jgi:predicted RNA-binding Zn-ribbon protein involved in translation (DUF1610 family)
MEICSKCQTEFEYQFENTKTIPEISIEDKRTVRWVCPECGEINYGIYKETSDIDQYCGWKNIRFNGLTNFKNNRNKLLSRDWFLDVHEYTFDSRSGVVVVKNKDGLWGIIDSNRKLLGNQWFKYVYYGTSLGVAIVVMMDNKFNIFSFKDEKLFSTTGFDNIKYTGRFETLGSEWCIPVCIDGKWNYCDIKGNIISDQWFDDCDIPLNNSGRVVLNGYENFLKPYFGKTEYLSSVWFDKCDYSTHRGYSAPEGWINGEIYTLYYEDGTKFKFTPEEIKEIENSRKYK